MTPQSPRAKEEFLVRWARDLSVFTENEIRERWDGGDVRRAIDILDREAGGFEGRVKGHNPIYYLAENVFFDNVQGDPKWLYAPFHKTLFCDPILRYYFQPKHVDAGFLLEAQRESFKSTFMHGIVPLFVTLRPYALEKRHARILLVHQKFRQASMNLERLRAKALSSRFLKKVWPEFTADERFGTQELFVWPCAEELTAHGGVSVMAGGLTTDFTGFHFDHVFFSDLVVKEHTKSRVMRENTEMFYDAFTYTVEMTEGKRWHDGTRYHINDLWGKMERSGKYHVVKVSAGGTAAGKPLSFPTRHSEEVLESMRQEEISRNGSDLMWWLQMQNDPRASAMIAASVEWLKYCKLADVPWDTWRCLFIDPAWKGTENQGEGDDASLQAWAFARIGSLVVQYLLELVASNELTEMEGRDHALRMMQKWGITDVAPEERGGKSFGTNLANDAVSRGIPFNLLTLKTQQVGKDQRKAAFLGAVQAGRVYLVEGSNYSPLYKQIEDYPQLDHDDHIDCAGYTADPIVAENYAPAFNAVASTRPWAQRPEDMPAPRTRYCG